MNLRHSVLASFICGDKHYSFIPDQMQSSEEDCYTVYETVAEGIKVSIEYRNVGNSAAEWTMYLENISDSDSPRLHEINGMDVSLVSDRGVVFESIRGDVCGAESYLPVKQTLLPGEKLHLEPYGGRSSNITAFPFFDISYGSSALLCAIGWTGEWRCDLEKTDSLLKLSAGVLHADFYLHPGEKARMPKIFLMTDEAFGGDITALRRDFRRLMMTAYSPLRFSGKNDLHFDFPISLETWDMYYGSGSSLADTYISEEGQLRIVGAARKIGGVDTFWIDANWFQYTAFCDDRVMYAKGFPNGFTKIAERLKAAGLRFCLWFEPEHFSKQADSFKLHPEDFLLKAEDTGVALLNYGDDKITDRLIGQLTDIIKKYGVDIFRNDFNTEPLPFWLYSDEPGRAGLTEIRYITNLYRLWDTLHERFPELIIDCCASGGRRLDFETMQRAVSLSRSDTVCAPTSPTRHSDVWNQNQTMALSRYLPYHGSFAWNMEANDFRSASTSGVQLQIDVLNPDYNYAPVNTAVAELIRVRRFWDGDFYELSDITLDEQIWSGYQLHSEADGCGLIKLFRRELSDKSKMSFKLNRIDRSRRYRLVTASEDYSVTERVMNGDTLADGIEIEIPFTHASASIEYYKL